MKKIVFLVFGIVLAFNAMAQNTASESRLKSIVEEGRREFINGNVVFNADSLQAAMACFEEYMEAFKSKSTRPVALRVNDPWEVIEMLSIIYDRLDSEKMLGFIDGTVRPYYRQCGSEYFKQYFKVARYTFDYLNRPQQPALSQQQQLDKLEALANELHDEAVATDEKSLILAFSISFVGWSEAYKGNNSKALKCFEKAREAGIPYLEKEYGSEYYFEYLHILTNVIQGYTINSKYDKAIEAADQLAELSKTNSSHHYLFALQSKAMILLRKGNMISMAPVIEQMDSICTFGQQIDPQLLKQARQMVEEYRLTFNPNSEHLEEAFNQDFLEMQKQYEDDLAEMEANPKTTDLYDYNNTVFRYGNALCMNNQLKKAMDMVKHAESHIQKHYSHIPYATRMVEGLYAKVWHSLGNLPEALRHLHKSEQMYEMAADHGIQYILISSGFLEILQASGDVAYTKLYLDRIYAFLENNDSETEDIPTMKILKAMVYMGYYMLGYVDIATEKIKELLDDGNMDQEGNMWDTIRLLWAYVNMAKGDYLETDRVLRKNLGTVSTKAEGMGTLCTLIYCNCALNNPEAITFLETLGVIVRQQVDQVMNDFNPNERQSYWERQSQMLVQLSNIVLYNFSGNEKARELAFDNILYAKSMQDRETNDCKTWNEVGSGLADNEVAVEFVSIPNPDNNRPVRYGALVLRNDYHSPRYVDLSPIEAVDKIWKEVAHTDKTLINKQYALNDDKIYSLIWKKIKPFIQSDDVVYYSTVGALGRINHSVVSDGRHRLGDLYVMNQVSTTADISDLKRLQWQSEGNAVVYGGIAYNESTAKMSEAASSYTKQAAMAERSAITLGGVTRGALNDDLKGTLEEARIINEVLSKSDCQVRLLTGSLANEESFKALGGQAPKILHIGTHGFMLSTNYDTEQHFNIISSGIDGKAMQRNLMQYCGLRMAGSNNAWRGQELPPNLEDGILTAYEISQVDLKGCQLVVLSACESGLGFYNYFGNDWGLIRAFKIAGAGTVIASLWEVPDDATSLLMQQLFTLLVQGTSPRKALLEAQKAVMKQYPDPYSWAAFILLDGAN